MNNHNSDSNSNNIYSTKRRQSSELVDSSQLYRVIVDDDGVDIKQFVITLWKNKLWIILSTTFFALLAIGYALLSQQWWSSTAKIDLPQLSQYAVFYNQGERLNQILDNPKDTSLISNRINSKSENIVSSSDLSTSNALNNLVNNNTIFTLFTKQFDSRSNKKDFLLEQQFIKDLLDEKIDKNNELTAKGKKQIIDRLLSPWIDKIKLIKSKNIEQTAVAISFQTKDSSQSLDMLQKYTDYVNNKVNSILYANLQILLNNKKSDLLFAKEKLFNQIESQLQSKIQLTKYSIDVAKAANIDKPLQQFNQESNDYFQISLGVDALQAQTKALSTIFSDKNYQIISPDYKNIENKISYLSSNEFNSKNSFNSFSYIDEPEQNISRDKPKRSLVVVLGLLFGFMFGIILVLVINSFKREISVK